MLFSHEAPEMFFLDQEEIYNAVAANARKNTLLAEKF